MIILTTTTITTKPIIRKRKKSQTSFRKLPSTQDGAQRT